MADLANVPPGLRFAEPVQPEAPQPEAQWVDPAAPRQLKYWTAYRSGAALSVSGMDGDTGNTTTITGISSLGPDSQGGVFIDDAQGQRWELVL